MAKLCLTQLIRVAKDFEQSVDRYNKFQTQSAFLFLKQILSALEMLFELWLVNDDMSFHAAVKEQLFEYLLRKVTARQRLSEMVVLSEEDEEEAKQEELVVREKKGRLD